MVMGKVKNLQNSFLENGKIIEQMIKGVNKAANINKQAAMRMKELNQQIIKIDKVIDSITNIAIQINLLSLNGSIEAARAGKQGKGFEVVANDIKELALNAANTVSNAKDVVTKMQEAAVDTADIITKFTNQSEIEVKRGEEILDEVKNTNNRTQNLIDIFNNLINITNEQVKVLEMAQKSSAQIAEATEEASKNTQQASATAQEQASGMEEIARAIQDIAEMTNKFQYNEIH